MTGKSRRMPNPRKSHPPSATMKNYGLRPANMMALELPFEQRLVETQTRRLSVKEIAVLYSPDRLRALIARARILMTTPIRLDDKDGLC